MVAGGMAKGGPHNSTPAIKTNHVSLYHKVQSGHGANSHKPCRLKIIHSNKTVNS